MPIYPHRCEKCGYEHDYIMGLAEPAPTHCGGPMTRQIGAPGVLGHNTAGGNLMHSRTTGASMKGNRKPKTIGRGRGLGGRRKPPSMKKEDSASKIVGAAEVLHTIKNKG